MDIALKNVEKSFTGRDGKHTALANVTLEIPSGAFVCLLGPSGCGKTTVLNLVAGFETPDQGEVLVDGHRVDGPGPDRVVMFQDPALFPWLSVGENVAFPLQKRKLSPAERGERVDEEVSSRPRSVWAVAWTADCACRSAPRESTYARACSTSASDARPASMSVMA